MMLEAQREPSQWATVEALGVLRGRINLKPPLESMALFGRRSHRRPTYVNRLEPNGMHSQGT